MYSKFVRAGSLMALLAAGLCAGAQAARNADVAVAGSQTMSPQVKAWLANRSKGPRADLSAQTGGPMDVQAPTLTAFNAAASIDAAASGSTMSASFKATDDLSGVSAIYAWATGPSGQYVDLTFRENVPSTKFGGKLLSSEISPFLEPGIYTFTGAYVEDFAGNSRLIDAAALAALGKVDFTVKNKKGFDVTPANLVGGEVLTPRVVLSVPHAGTNLRPFVQVAVTATDVGNTAVSGVSYALATFCHESGNCIHVSSAMPSAGPGAISANLKLGAAAPYYLGDYRLKSVTLGDYAGNDKTWTSTEFGGDTDFSTTFPSTTITIVP